MTAYLLLLNWLQLWKRYKGDEDAPESLGKIKEYNVDMIPKVHP